MQYPRNIFEQFTKIKGDIVKKKNVDAAFELADTKESSKPLLRVRTDLSL